MNTKGHRHSRRPLAFTLIELLTVIAIMAIVAALVVTMGQAASVKKKQTQVKGELSKLTLMINNYYSKLNYYPPDNGLLASATLQYYDGLAATNPLLYELMGGTNDNSSLKQPRMVVFTTTNVNTELTEVSYSDTFNRGGIANADAVEPHDFFQPGPSPKEYAPYGTLQGNTIYGLIVPVELFLGNTNNFWHYDSSSTNRHNMTSFDLWAEYSIGSKGGHPINITNGNW